MKLNKDNIEKFFVSRLAPKLPFEFIEIKERDEVSKYSNNNYLWRLVVKTATGDRVFFVKQAQKYNKRSVIAGRPINVDPARICGEYKLMTLFTPVLNGLTIFLRAELYRGKRWKFKKPILKIQLVGIKIKKCGKNFWI